MGEGVLALSGGFLIPTLIFTMITSLILGMGAPTTANYIITSTCAAPAILALGVPVLAAHMFVFYFGIIADITPPVALAAFAGAAIAKANPMKTGIEASKLAIAAFIVPYIFVLSPEILMINATPWGIAQTCITAIMGMIGVGAAVEGWYWTRMSWWERITILAGGLLLIVPGTMTDLIGLGLMALITVIQYIGRGRQRPSRRFQTVLLELVAEHPLADPKELGGAALVVARLPNRIQPDPESSSIDVRDASLMHPSIICKPSTGLHLFFSGFFS